MYSIQEPNCQVLKLTFLFEVGRDLESKRALAQATSYMLKKATLDKSYTSLQAELDRYGANVEIYSTPLFLTVELYCQSKLIDYTLPIFFELLFEAKFNQKDWKIVQNQTIEFILQNEKQSDFWADKLMSEYLLGFNHPLGYYSQKEDYLAISIEDIQSFYNQNIFKSLPLVFLAGEYHEDLKTMILNNLSKYKLKSTFRPILAPIENLKPSVLIKKMEDNHQSSVRLGLIIPRSSFQDFIHFEVINTFLGGYYNSQLMKLLRIENGYTYGVYSQLIHFPQFSMIQIAFELNAEFVKPAISEINKLFLRLKLNNAIDFEEAVLQYHSQWVKNSERSLQEISFPMKLSKLGYSYEDFKVEINKMKKNQYLKYSSIQKKIFDLSLYTQAIVS